MEENKATTYAKGEMRTAQVFVFLITIGVLILIIGGIWAIKDIFTTTALATFLNYSIFTKTLIVGAICLGIFIIGIFMVVFYRKGRDALLKSIFQEKVRNTQLEEFKPAHVITFGLLISITGVLISFAIIGIQALLTKSTGSRSDVSEFFNNLTGGVQILLVGAIFMAAVLFFLAFIYFWYNGYYFIVSRILHRNEKYVVPWAYSKSQKNTGMVFFILFIASILTVIIGLAWAIGDYFSTDKFQAFLNASLGVEFLIITLIATIIFALLILAMFFYKSGNMAILTSLYFKNPLPETNKNYPAAKVITIGIMAGFSLIVIAVVAWVFSKGTSLMHAGSGGSFFEDILGLSGGLRVMAFGIMFTLAFLVIFVVIYIGHNGYAMMVNRIVKTQDQLEETNQ